MKNKLIELDVDFIGGQEKMTKEEELLISEYIKKSKERYLKAQKRKTTRISNESKI
jgi:hypothetical protein